MTKWLAQILMASMLALALVASPQARAQEAADNADDDAFTRENPELGTEAANQLGGDYSAYPFIHIDADTIALNGADWSALRRMMANSGDTVIQIVHIGDSHIQAEGSTSRTRTLLAQEYGYAGRGLVTPFRLAGTNQALDYSITSDSKFQVAKLLKRPWPIDMGFTGVALEPQSRRFDFTIAVKPREGLEPDFDFVRMFVHGAMPKIVAASSPTESRALFSEAVNADTLTIFLYEPTAEVSLKFESQGKCQIFGFQLENQMTGIEYHAIGNNGATYTSYTDIGTMGSDLRTLDPALVIISLGTNEAFGRITDETFYANIDMLVRDITRHNPVAQILLTTPAECQRSTRVRRGKRRVKTYSVNTNVARLRSVILRYGREHGIATYDWYDVAGGDGSSEHWLEHKLMNTDRIHNTWSGYDLQGSLLYDALYHSLQQ